MRKQKYSVHNENLLFSTGNSTQRSVSDPNEKTIHLCMDIYVCVCTWDMYMNMGYMYMYSLFTLLNSRN